MRTLTLTFHGSHNYGSMLQAYALQQAMISVFGENKILNFRSKRQKRMMRVISLRPQIGPILKDVTHLFYLPQLIKKHSLFESFIKKELHTTEDEIPSVNERDLEGYDLICCGSDQIWNPCPEDFDMAYLLPFKTDAKKISYAASMGPGRDSWPSQISDFPNLLNDYDAISVRETGSKDIVVRLTGRKDVNVNCDPVFLLNPDQWKELIEERPVVRRPYIFLYTLFANPTIVACAKALSDKYNLPVVISNYTNVHDLFSSFKKNLKAGPKEFLNLLCNAKMVVTSSFHGTAFATLLNRPFVAINGMNDNRISNLLRLTGLETRSVSSVEEVVSIGWDIDFSKANQAIASERKAAFEYLSQFKK